MHRIVARLMMLSGVSSASLGCAREPIIPPPDTAARPLAEVEKSSPDLVSEALIRADFKSSTVTFSAARCMQACGALNTGCDIAIEVAGDPQRPSALAGHLQCHFPENATSKDTSWDPFGLNSCPFGCGRRPPSMLAVDVDLDSAIRSAPTSLRSFDDLLIEHCARIAAMEELSVPAFRQLTGDLRKYAPRLVPRALRARRDERRHARRARAVLRELGGAPPRLPEIAYRDRNLFDAALDNAVEGCVVETVGAVLLSMQAQRATHRSMRAFFAAVAVDEINHASLAWEVHDALLPQLDDVARASVVAAQLRAIRDIELASPAPRELRSALGAPSDQEWAEVVAAMRSSLLSESSA